MSALEDRLYDYLLPCLHVTEDRLIEAHADVPRPVKSYVDFHVISDAVVGVSNRTVDEDGMLPIDHVKTLVVQLNFYGKDSKEEADLFLLKLEMESTLVRGELLNFGLLSYTTPVDSSTEIAKTWERRQSVRLTLSHTAFILDDVGLIEHVEIDGDFN